MKSPSRAAWRTDHLPEQFLFARFSIVVEDRHPFSCIHHEEDVMNTIQGSSQLGVKEETSVYTQKKRLEFSNTVYTVYIAFIWNKKVQTFSLKPIFPV